MIDKELTPVESLRLIEAMIQRSSQHIQQRSWIPFLVWGYLSMVTSLLIYFLLPSCGPKTHILWLLIPLIGWGVAWRNGSLMPGQTNAIGISPIDRVTSIIWTVLGINASICSVVIGSNLTLFIILLLMTIGAMMTALVTRFRMLLYMSIIGMLMSYGMLLFPIQGREILLYFSLAFVLIFIIPGHILQHQFKGKTRHEAAD